MPLHPDERTSVMLVAGYGQFLSTCLIKLPHDTCIFCCAPSPPQASELRQARDRERVRRAFLDGLPDGETEEYANGCVYEDARRRALLLFSSPDEVLDVLSRTGTELSAFAGFTGVQLRWDYSGRCLRINEASFLDGLLRVSGDRLHFYTDCTPELISKSQSRWRRHRWYKPSHSVSYEHGRYQFILNGVLVCPWKTFVEDWRPDLLPELLHREDRFEIVKVRDGATEEPGDLTAGGLEHLLPLRMFDELEIIAHYDVCRES